jgi:riboflavin synthase
VFTGLVQAVGVVGQAEASAAGRRLVIDAGAWTHRPAPGESISVSGACLTQAGPFTGELVFDVIPETLEKTTLGGLEPGSRVNLERSLAAGDLIGGHFVQGHVDGVGTVERVQTEGEWRVRIAAPEAVAPYLVPKGSIAVAGVSLTLAAVEGDSFEIALIPTTLEETTLGDLQEGDGVNLEADTLAKTVATLLERRQNG